MALIRTRTRDIPSVKSYPESMRGGAWDRDVYAGSDDAALAEVRRLSYEAFPSGARPMLRAYDQRPSWTAARPQWYHDSWRHAWRLLRYLGDCVACGRRTYAFDDGENDPRGILGDRAAQPITNEDVPALGADDQYVAACFPCMNDEPRYRRALEIAARAAAQVVRA